jgi:two-component system sensor histidine kinase DesK
LAGDRGLVSVADLRRGLGLSSRHRSPLNRGLTPLTDYNADDKADCEADCETGSDAAAELRRHEAWGRGWRGVVFPSVFLVYLLQTLSGIFNHTDGALTVLGIVVLLLFCAAYLVALQFGRSGRYHGFWYAYGALVALFAAELPFAHEDAMVMLVYICVLSVASLFLKALPVLVACVLVALFVPALIKPWHVGIQGASSLAIGIVSLAMFSFFGVVRANEALSEARAEVARLAAEGERTRIARDLHDLLGHSLTTITVKAALAHRLSRVDPDRAAGEIAEVEALARRTLTDVRAAVSGYREITLGNELAAAREVLRAAGITGQLPNAIDSVEPAESVLFGWVVREGITNVVRHSRAHNCEVRLGERFIEITDDGIGAAAKNGNGLIGLTERVVDAGGRLTAGAKVDGQGWRLLVEVD